MANKGLMRLVQLTFEDAVRKRRKGAGRKKCPDSGVPHLKRERVTARTPVLITLKLRKGLPFLRRPEEYRLIWKALEEACMRPGRSKVGGFRIVDYVVLGDHLHLLVEATDNEALARGIAGLCKRMASGLNKLWLGRKGKVFRDRYHMRVLKTPREVYYAKRYVYENARKHLLPTNRGRPDPFSSGLWFPGWKDYVHDGWVSWKGPVAEATSWLLREGWKLYGLFELRPAWDKTIV